MVFKPQKGVFFATTPNGIKKKKPKLSFGHKNAAKNHIHGPNGLIYVTNRRFPVSKNFGDDVPSKKSIIVTTLGCCIQNRASTDRPSSAAAAAVPHPPTSVVVPPPRRAAWPPWSPRSSRGAGPRRCYWAPLLPRRSHWCSVHSR